MKRKLATYLFSLFFVGSPKRRAVASTIGFLLAFVPLGGYNGLVAFFIALFFRLNLLALSVGFSTYLFIPFIEFLILKIFPDYNSPLDSAPWLIGIGVVLSALFYLLFLWFHEERRRDRQVKQEKWFVFQDHGRRWRFLKRSIVLIVVVSLLSLSIFADSLFTKAIIPQLVTDQAEAISAPALVDNKWKNQNHFPYQKYDPTLRGRTQMTAGNDSSLTTYGFYVPWDPRGWLELKEYGVINKLDVLIPQWYSIGEDFSLVDQKQPEVDNLAKQHHVKLMPLVNNVNAGKWDGELLHRLFVSPQKRSQLIQTLLLEAIKNGYAGINIDFEAVLPKDRHLLTTFMTELSAVFHKNGLKVTEDVPANDRAFDYPSLAKAVDQMIVMMYDEHFAGSTPGPLSSLGWDNYILKKLPIPKEKMIIALGNYGYDWTVNSHQPATPVSFDEIMQMADQYHLHVDWDKGSKNPYVRYKKGNEEHVIWFLDGSTFYNQLKLLSHSGTKGIALWRLGSEDSSIWKIFGKMGSLSRVRDMQTFVSDLPLYTGQGEILHIESKAKRGERDFKQTKDGWISEEDYKKYSSSLELKGIGEGTGKEIALTFDDGPSSEYTKEILDILDRYQIHATFFIVGQNAVLYPDLVKRMVESGHEVGNHTYTHANLAKVSPDAAQLELNTTQRAFQSITGRTMTLFRPPYDASAIPDSTEQIVAMIRAKQMGYITVGESVDSEDWRLKSSDQIIRQVMNGLDGGHILLFHDGGGDRSATVKALPVIIETLKKHGYRFVTVSQLMGTSRDQVMPQIHPADEPVLTIDKVVFAAIKICEQGFTILLYVSIGIGFIRIFLLLVYSYQQRIHLWRRRRTQNYIVAHYDYYPPVSVVIAAYNEEKVINKTIHSILRSDYDPLEIIIVNDGSTDRTEEVILEEFGDHPQVHVISKPNSGKTDSINVGYQYANGEIIVSIDADTIIAENAISLLVRHFVDPEVAAVSGNVKVGNVRNLLTLWQHVEYITGFNLERRAFDKLNSIPVVPGAIGAWRKSAVEEAGYFQHDTLAEDTDITLTLLRLGYKVQYEDRAYAYTEAPEDIKSFIKQRTRWIYGTLQCLWKHRGALFSGKQKSLGFITLPNMWGFQYGVQLLSPFVDILSIVSFFTSHATKTLLFYIAFLIFDMLAAFFAFSMEKESPKPLIWLFLQRFVYRQFMTYIVFKSIFYALKGVSVGWNKLGRKGNVTISR
jgi:cellulose synthase/poly-beta-1,6-N-acetylglucosamine synthase-like glycosyltransferase/spore germination protein YaaH/peptidoglycan/xylan/chitin deacetylase (PgdA/CDA1 family)